MRISLRTPESDFQARLTGLFYACWKTGQYHQQPGYTFPVPVVSRGQHAGQLSPAHAQKEITVNGFWYPSVPAFFFAF